MARRGVRVPVSDSHVPALGRRSLTRLYDPVIAATMREKTFRARLLDQAALAPGTRVLDVGCGTGTLAVAAKRRQPDAEVVGVDADRDVLDRAARKAESAGVSIRFDRSPAQDLPYPDDSFDVALSTLLFHHLDSESKAAAARELARVLRPGGRLHLADWGPPTGPLMALAFVPVRLLDGLEPTRDNVRGRLPRLFESAGFRVTDRGRLRTVFGTLAFYELDNAGELV